MRKGIEVSEAIKLLLDTPVKPLSETVPIEAALRRVSSEDIRAKIPFPPFDRSPFDGYAFRGEDTTAASDGNPVTLSVGQEIPAGQTPKKTVEPGFAAKILTGAPIPPGANAVIKFEETEFTKDSVTIFKSVTPGTNILRAGEDIKVGEMILPKGQKVSPASIGLLAAQGMAAVNVFKKPVITVINTGSELAELGRPLPPGMIYNSSMFTLQGFLDQMGTVFCDGGIAPDDEDVIAARVQEALDSSDMVITTGGASVGDYDCAVAAAQRAGGDILFWKIKMRPGGALLVYRLGDKLVLSLSGNPGAAVLGLLLIGLPYIKKLSGLSDVMPEECTVLLKTDLKKGTPRTRIMRGSLEIVDGSAVFAENQGQGGGDISSLVTCDLLAEIPAGSPPLPAGTRIKAYRLFK